jgi:hypothetical protein
MEINTELYTIFIAIENINKDGSTKKEIINYIEPIYLFMNNNLSIDDVCFKIININFETYIEKEYLLCVYNNNTIFYSINYQKYEYNKYKEYYEKYKLKLISIINNIIEINDISLNNMSISDIVKEDNKKEYYICKSFTNNDIYYLDKNLKTCTCKSYVFAGSNRCKHLEHYRNNDTSNIETIFM